DIAERLRHFSTLLIHGEAMGENLLVGRAAARATAFKQRGLEPAAMLVRAFKIEIGGRWQAAALKHESVGRAGIKPDIENVRHLLPFIGVVFAAKELGCRALEPGISAFLRYRLNNARIHLLVAQQSAV